MPSNFDADPHPVQCDRLTSWSVAVDGSRVRLGVADHTGQPAVLDVPTEVLSGLMMTIPRMLQQALVTRGDNTSRIVHQLGDWRLERTASADLLLLTMTTPDGFAVTFSLTRAALAQMTTPVDAGQPWSEQKSRLLN